MYGVDFAARTLYVHGAVASRSLAAEPDAAVRFTVTHADGLVLARSAFEYGANHRSAMVSSAYRGSSPGAPAPRPCCTGRASSPGTARPARGTTPAAPTPRSRPPLRCSRRSWTRPR
ncbi:pyridoxamine 5'-phosphate oxidase family protein [Streptomyces sp. NPDC003016]